MHGYRSSSKYDIPRAVTRAIALAASIVLTLAATTVAAEPRPITVWLIPSEEAEARAASDAVDIAKEIRDFNQSLAHGSVRVLNTLPPLDQQLIVWNSEFAVPNWAWVKNQTETIKALERFADLHKVKINVRFLTWDRAFADLNLPRKADDQNPPPDVVQIGTTWAAYFVSKGLIVSRSGVNVDHSPWQPVLDTPLACLPYITDTRLLFYWKRLPMQSPSSSTLKLETSSWESTLDSLRTGGGPEDRLAFAGGLTLNLMFDYSMLEWAGGGDPIHSSRWRNRADFTSENALKVPLVLTQASSGRNGRRLVVVPESSHQELTKEFVVGQYRGIIEPANFISRWKKDFDKTYQGKKQFWDYAAAAVPPQPFKGGSYLAVMRSPDLPPVAFELAEFLGMDNEYTSVLARNAQLPSLRDRNGIDVLLSWLGGGDFKEAQDFTKLVQQANIQGRSFPDLPDFPTTIESTEVQEALQRMWRRIGDGDSERLKEEAKSAETILNLKIDRVAKFRYILVESWWLVAIPLLILVTFWGIQARRHLTQMKVALTEANAALDREAAANDQVRKLRGFSAMALLALARYHHSLRDYECISDGMNDAKKRSIIAAGISGWRRGRNQDNWQPAPVVDVVWRGILLGFDIAIEPDVYERWECARERLTTGPREFLEGLQVLRKTKIAEDSDSSYFIDVCGDNDFMIQAPFLFEQAMGSLIQNAIQACDRACDDRGPRLPILVSITPLSVTVSNPGDAFPLTIQELINQSRTPQEFEESALRAVRSKGGNVPGIGLTEAYTIASQYYGGLKIAEGQASISIHLKSEGPAQ